MFGKVKQSAFPILLYLILWNCFSSGMDVCLFIFTIVILINHDLLDWIIWEWELKSKILRNSEGRFVWDQTTSPSCYEMLRSLPRTTLRKCYCHSLWFNSRKIRPPLYYGILNCWDRIRYLIYFFRRIYRSS